MESVREAALSRLADLTQAGAERAAAAFAQLTGGPVEARPPVVREGGPGRARGPLVLGAGASGPGDGEGSTGVFFEFEGCVDALVGILFSAEGSERLVRSVVGIESGALDPTIVESALMEVGNILASHVASGIADALRSRLLPSIPALAQGRAEGEFEAWVERVVGDTARRVEVELRRPGGDVVGRLVVVPSGPVAEDDLEARGRVGRV
ncbi:MAG: chemotaxis protein CheC [Myxococcota bacterium]